MAGFDTVDPAYACVPPVSFATLIWRIAITPNSRLTKNVRTPIGSRDIPDPGKIPHVQAGVTDKPRVLDHEDKTQDCSVQTHAQGHSRPPRGQGHRAICTEFHGLRAAAGSSLPLFRRSQILPARRALLRAGYRHRQRWEKPATARDRARKTFSAREGPGSAQAPDRTTIRRRGISHFKQRSGRLLGEPWPAAWHGRTKPCQLPRAN